MEVTTTPEVLKSKPSRRSWFTPEQTPTPEVLKSKPRRRSWFTPGQTTSFKIAVERTGEFSDSDHEEIDILLLTHFTNPPKIDFGAVKLGKSTIHVVTRKLRIKNPHDYDQEVRIEKFPFKKGFGLDRKEFVVAAEDHLDLIITWSPTEAANCREMVLFKVEDIYRLHAFLIGCAEEPPKPKKRKTWKPPKAPLVPSGKMNQLPPTTLRRTTFEVNDSRSPCRETFTKHDGKMVTKSPNARARHKGMGKSKKAVGKFSPIQDENTPPFLEVLDEGDIKESAKDNESERHCYTIQETGGVFTHKTHSEQETHSFEHSHSESCSYTPLGKTYTKEHRSQSHHAQQLVDTSTTTSHTHTTETKDGVQVHTEIVEIELREEVTDVDIIKEDIVTEVQVFVDGDYVSGSVPNSHVYEERIITEDVVTENIITVDHDQVGSPYFEDSLIEENPVQKVCSKSSEPQRSQADLVQTPSRNFLSPDSFLESVQGVAKSCQSGDYSFEPVVSPGTLLNDSIPHQVIADQLENVKTELKHRLSSTPIPRGSKSTLINTDANIRTLINESSLSKIDAIMDSPKCSRVSSETFLPAKQLGKNSGSFFLIPAPENTRRISSVTVTKSKPSVISGGSVTGTSHASKQLFARPANRAKKANPKEPTKRRTSADFKSTRRLSGAGQQVSSKRRSGETKHTQKSSSIRQVADADTKRQWSTKPGRKSRDSMGGWSNNKEARKSLGQGRSRAVGTSTFSVGGECTKGSTFFVEEPAGLQRTTVGSDRQKRSLSEARAGGITSGGANKKRKTAEYLEAEEKPTRDRMLTRTQQLRQKAARSSIAATEKSSIRRSQDKGTKVKRSAGLMKGVASSRLVLMKNNVKTALPKHPLPYAAKNVYYDERWMEKQSNGFVRWLNFILTPPDEYFIAKKPTKIDAGVLCLESQKAHLAPSKEVLSFKRYAAERRLNRLRRAACMLYQSEAVVCVIQKLEAEVESGRLLVRKDRKIRADLGIKQQILEMILSYNPLWLRIGLETIYGEIVQLQTNTDVIGLCRFILTRLLGNPDIAKEYAHPTVPHLYRDGYDEAMARFTLKKFLLLVFFLDKAKHGRLIDHDPCLFCKDADFKASRDLLISFSRDFLSGEGDVTRHLGYLGYNVSHVQTALEEYDFAVKNLATDLRDGLRLTRVVELLTHNWRLTARLRAPAISRLQKIHNTEVAFTAVAEKGVDLRSVKGGKLDPRDIVDGHREKTLTLLWQIIYNFQVEMLINMEQLREEVACLKRLLQQQTLLMTTCTQDLDCVLGIPEERRRESLEPDLYFKSDKLSLLLKWCRAVCAFYDMKIENFTVSFSDGRAFCYLVHHYHPSLLPLEDIHTRTIQTYEGDVTVVNKSASDSDSSFTGTWASSFSPTTGKPMVQDELLANERENFRLLYEKVSELGGIPILVKSADMSNTIPDEKVVITYVSFLCTRLLDIRQEARAARIIQLAWRRYRKSRCKEEFQAETRAAVMIQRWIRDFLAHRKAERRERACVKIQATWRGAQARKRLQTEREILKLAHKTQAVVKIQACVRRYLARTRLHKIQKSVVRIQAFVRGYVVRKQLAKEQRAVVVLQRRYRAHKLMLQKQNEYRCLHKGIICLQALYRGFSTRMALKENHAATLIQKSWRAFIARKKYVRLRSAVLKIQALVKQRNASRRLQQMKRAVRIIQVKYRAHKLRHDAVRDFQRSRSAAISIQANIRGYLCRKQQMKMQVAAIVIQTLYRKHRDLTAYKKMKKATKIVQVKYRAHRLRRMARREFQKTRSSVILIQAHVRGHLCRRELMKKEAAAVIIQTVYRQHRDCVAYQKMKHAARVIQTRYKSYVQTCKDRSAYVALKKACITVQKTYRGWKAFTLYKQQREATIRIQSMIRMYACRQRYHKLQSATATIQKYVRATLQSRQQRRTYLIEKGACITIQATIRAWLCRLKYTHLRQSTINIQAHFRGTITRKRYSAMKNAALVLQKRYRAKVEGQKQCLQFNVMKGAAITIQAWVRGCQLRGMISKLHRAATCIQSMFRCHIARQRYVQKKKSAIILQRAYRAFCAGCQQRSAYKATLQAIVTLQAGVRGYLERRNIQRLQSAARCIQRSYRMHVARQRYLHLKHATLVLQSRYRALLLTRKQQALFNKTKRALTKIQAYVRGYLVRKQLKHQSMAVVKIQSVFRGCRARAMYKSQKEAAVVIQRHFRNYKAGQQIRRRFICARISAVKIQALIRKHQLQQRYLQMRQAAITLQSQFRAYRAKSAYARQRSAVLTLQRYYRSYRKTKETRKQYVHILKSVVKIQSFIRKCGQCKRFLKMRQAAVKLQSLWRGHYVRRMYRAKRDAAVVIQRCFRNHMVRHKTRKHYVHMKTCVVKIQSFVRMYQQSKRHQRVKHAAITIQSHFRAFRTRAACKARVNAVLMIQRFYRSYKAGQQIRSRYLHMQKSAVKIQSVFRTYQQRRRFMGIKAATIRLQSLFRGYRVKKLYVAKKEAAKKIQTHYRAVMLRNVEVRKYHITRGAIITIQAGFRGYKTRLQLKRIRAAKLIQSAFRGYVARKDYQKTRHAVVTIQSRLRGWQQRRRLQLIQHATMVLQKHWRATLLGREQRRKYLIMIGAAITIQAKFRAYKACLFVKKIRAAVKLQSVYRGYVARKEYKQDRQAVVKIQSRVRGWLERKRFQQLVHAVSRLQIRWRATLLARCQQRQYLIMVGAAITLQARFRAFRVRKQFTSLRKDVVYLQACVRRHIQRKKYLRIRQMTIVIQRRYRATLVCRAHKKKYQSLKQTVVKLQAIWQGQRARRYVKKIRAAVKLQSVYRGYVARKEYKQDRQAVVKIQSRVRGWLERKRFQQLVHAVSRLQMHWRATLLARCQQRQYRIMVGAAITIQARFRAFRVRKQFTSLRKDVVYLQACMRRHIQRKKYLRIRQITLVIQRRYRATLVCRAHKEKYQSLKQTVVKLQAVWRGQRARRYVSQVKAVRKVQSAVRMWIERRNFLAKCRAARKIQAWYRCAKEQESYLKTKYATYTLQRYVRAYLIGEATRRHLRMKLCAAIRIQSCYRGFKARQRCKQVRAAIVLQSAIRGHLQRIKYKMTMERVMRLQARIRGHLARKEFATKRRHWMAAVYIQRHYRAYQKRKAIKQQEAARKRYLHKCTVMVKKHLSVVRIQRCFRRYRTIIRASQRIDAVLVIQRWMRAKLERLHYLKVHSAVSVLQRAFRVHQKRKEGAVIRIQAVTRGWQARKEMERRKWAILKIQSVWRGRAVRIKVKDKRVKMARKRVMDATKNATEEKKLCNRTTSALDYLLRYKQLSFILDALIHLDAATRLSARCCERLVEGAAVPVIYTLIRSCNRSLPHMELIKYSVNVLLNLVKYEKTRLAVYEIEDSIETLIDLLQIYREKGDAIFCRVCMLMAIVCHQPRVRKEVLALPRVSDKLRSIHLLVQRKHKMRCQQMITKTKMNSSFCVPSTPSKCLKIRPEWILRGDKMKEITDQMPAIKFLLDVLHLTPK